MTDLWRRQAVQAAAMRGAPLVAGPSSMRETNPGRVVDSAVFLCGPADPAAPFAHRPVRLEVSVRVGVTIHSHQVLNPRGDTRDLDWTSNIAIGARGGHEDRRYFIHPNGVLPAGMRRPLWGVFLGR